MAARRLAAVLVLAAIGLVASACDGSDEAEGISYSGFLTASEFVVGPNRFPFGLVSRDGELLDGAAVTVSFFSVNEDQAEFLVEKAATWRTVQQSTPHEHADGEQHIHLYHRGMYVVDEVVIPKEGVWFAEFTALRGNEAFGTEGAAFRVASEPSAPGVGEPVPATENLTIHEVTSFAEISTRAVEDAMHNVSVATALESGEPFVVFFASPQFCLSALCGPVADTMDEARAALGGEIEFIHIEPWDLRAAREDGRLVAAPIVDEWHLPTEPWTFVVDADGLVAKRFEGLVAVPEVMAALDPLR